MFREIIASYLEMVSFSPCLMPVHNLPNARHDPGAKAKSSGYPITGRRFKITESAMMATALTMERTSPTSRFIFDPRL